MKDIEGRRNEMTEAEVAYMEMLFRKYGAGPILDAVAAIIEPHEAESDVAARRTSYSTARQPQRTYAHGSGTA